MIIFDTETTNLVKAVDVPDHNQPKIIELFALKVNDDTLEEEDVLSLLIDPMEPITEEITGITGITDEMVKGKGSFSVHYPSIANFWLGQRTHTGHNLTFDTDMLYFELRRLGKELRFPWPINGICTVEISEHLEGRRLKLIDLHRKLLGEGFESSHRAEADVRATHRCLVKLKETDDLPNLM